MVQLQLSQGYVEEYDSWAGYNEAEMNEQYVPSQSQPDVTMEDNEFTVDDHTEAKLDQSMEDLDVFGVNKKDSDEDDDE